MGLGVKMKNKHYVIIIIILLQLLVIVQVFVNKDVVLILKKDYVWKILLKEFVKKSPSQFGSFWKKAVFTGAGKPPKSFKTEADLIRYVTSSPGSIGYIDASTLHEGVLVLQVQ